MKTNVTNINKIIKITKVTNTYKRGRYKRAQVEGNVLIYVLGVFIASMILLFGYSAVNNFVGIKEDITSIQLKQTLSLTVEEKLDEYLSRETKAFELQGGANNICFHDSSKQWVQTQGSDLDIISYIVSKNPPLGYNVFLMDDSKIVDTFSVGKLSIETGLKCFEENNGVVTITFIAKGVREGVEIA